jgi:bacteriocin-like protein
MNTLINANEARELSTDELSAVTGGEGQCNSSGPSWGQIAAAANAATYVAGAMTTGGGGLVTELAMEGAKSMAKQLRQ